MICSVFTAETSEWNALEGVKGDIPAPRTHHTSTCTWRDRLFVFSGGSSGTSTLDNSIYLFDIGNGVCVCVCVCVCVRVREV